MLKAFFFGFILFVSDVPFMSYVQKTSPDPVKFGPDPNPGPHGLQRTSDTKSIKTKKKAFEII